MSPEEKGHYISVLCNIHFHGHLSEKELDYICGGMVPISVLRCLVTDEEGKYYHKRMEYDTDKRMKYSESRQKNLKKKTDERKETNVTAEKKSAYGPYGNVMLTNEEYEDLMERFGTGLDARIKQLSEYMKISGKTYDSHYAVIIQWDERNKEKAAEETERIESTFDTDDFFQAAIERSRQYWSSIPESDDESG